MKPVYHKVVTCQYCGTEYDKGKRTDNDWHKLKLCIKKDWFHKGMSGVA